MRCNFIMPILLLAVAAISRSARIFDNGRSPASSTSFTSSSPSEEATSSPTEFVPTTNCPLCDLEKHPIRKTLSAADLRALRINIIKTDILHKLHLERQPNITVSMPSIPQPLSTEDYLNNPPAEVENKDISDYYGKTTEIISVGDIIPRCYGYKPSTCAFFDVSADSINMDDVESVILWVYKLRDGNDSSNQTLVISELAAHTRKKYRSRRMVAHKTTSVEHGWVQFNIKNTLRRWLEKPRKNFGLRISCKTCERALDDGPVATKNKLRPFLQIHLRGSSRHRSKRGIKTYDCDASVNKCCKEQFYVSFAEIGYSFIAKPVGYFANYCKGPCSAASAKESFIYSHTQVLGNVNENLDAQTRQDITPCCTPMKMSSLSVIYSDKPNEYKKTNMPNMIVDNCGCA